MPDTPSPRALASPALLPGESRRGRGV